MQPSVCFQVQKIIGVSTGKGNLKNYQVQWAPSWVSGFHLVGCEDLIEQFLKQQSNDELDTDEVKIELYESEVLQDESGSLFDDATSDDPLNPGLSPRRRLSEDSHETAFSNINDAVFCFDKEEDSGLLAKDSGKSLNPNFEWIGKDVSEVCDGSGKDTHPKSDLLTDGNGDKAAESGGQLSSFESTFAFSRKTNRSKSIESLTNFGKKFINGEFLEIKREEKESAESCFTSGKDIAYSGSFGEVGLSRSSDENSYSVSCTETASSVTIGDKHKDIHPFSGKTYKCETCQKVFKNNGSLRRHSKIHMAGGNAFRCGICYRRFESQANLQKHELIHSGSRKYACNICNKKFSENGNLQAHIRTHTGERPYKCTYCSKMFLTSSDLKRHLRVHTGERPYECKVCHKRFKINDHLQKHTRTHVEERPSMCDNI